jgi:hypothetical protein
MTIKELLEKYLILSGNKGFVNHKKYCRCDQSNLLHCNVIKSDFANCEIIEKGEQS